MWENHPLLKNEMIQFEKYIKDKFPEGKAFLDDLSHDAIFSGGKRLRPALTIMCALGGDYDREKVFPVAAALEVLHTATLIHDDIIDNADTRRGKPTISNKHGVNLAVYTGDYLLSSSVLMLAQTDLTTDMLNYIAKAVKLICIGEANQYLNRFSVTGVASYLRRVMKKTGILFTAACVCGAHISGLERKQMVTMAKFGLNFGVAFQIRDDLLDMESDRIKEGKPVNNDLEEGIITLPFIYAALKDKNIKEKINDFQLGIADAKDVYKAVKDTDGPDDAKKLKNRYVLRCRSLLADMPEKSAFMMEELLTRL